MTKISLKLDETNELKFKISIQGNVSEPNATKPLIRMIMNEKDNDNSFGFVFKVSSVEDETLVFKIPILSGVARVGVPYEAKIEVLLGSRLFIPMTMEINFTKNMSVEVSPIKEAETKEVDVLEILSEVESAKSPNIEKKKIKLTKSELEKLLKEAKTKAKPPEVKKTTTKDELKSLLKSSIMEE